MMRWIAIVLPMLCGLPALADDAESDALQLADDTPAAATEARPWQAHAELAAGAAWPQTGAAAQQDTRISLDWRLEPTASGPWQLRAAGRLDVRSRPAPMQEHTVHTLKDAVLGYTASPQVLVEAGRIRLRQGVALGYNPTDFFRDGSVRSEVSMDPASLRENRQGSGMVRVQQLGADGAWQLAYSPRLAQRKPAPSGWHPDWGATNHQHRALLAFAPRWSESLSAQGLLHLRQGHSAQWGLNLSGLVDQATVAHLEWAAGQARTQWHEALDLPGPQRWRHRLAAGATHTTRHKLTLTAELHYNGTAPGRSAWQALRGEPLPAYLQYRAWSLQALEPPTRWALFFHATWKDALMPGLDLSSLWHLDRVDASRRFWLEARYRGKAFDVALQWQRNHGAPLSQFGLWPAARRWELSVRRYF